MIRALLLSAALALAPTAAIAAPPKPKLIVVISIDQFSADLFAEYRQRFDGGLRRLSEGVVFPAGYQGHAATETCPGHSTILTGSRPSRTGIIANRWFDLDAPRADKRVYCAEDERVPGSDSTKYTASPVHLRVPTLGGRMKIANPAARVVSVAGKDRAALMMGGPTADQLWWWDGKTYVSPAAQTPEPIVAQVNASIADAIARPRPALALSPFCAAHERAIPVGEQAIGAGRFARAAGDLTGFRYSPEADAATLTLAAALIEEMALGKREATDIISIGLSATDYVGHAYGTEGSEMCLQLTTLDDELGAFFDRLDASGIDYLVALTADHGGLDIPERQREHAIPGAARVDTALEPDAIAKAIGAKLGLGGPILFGDGPGGDFYIDRALTPAQRAQVLEEAVAMLGRNPQVAAVVTRKTLLATPSPKGPPDTWTLVERARASFDPERSGDFILLLKPRIMPIPRPRQGYTSTHGSPWDYDRRVPILFWWKGATGFEQPLAVETADILPTLAALIDLPVPAGEIDGRCLDLDAGAGTSCR